MMKFSSGEEIHIAAIIGIELCVFGFCPYKRFLRGWGLTN